VAKYQVKEAEQFRDRSKFTNRKQDTSAFEHIFARVCRENNIDHRLTKVNHPWTNGQVERMNRTIKEATVKRYHYDTHSQLETHITDFILRRGRQSTGLSSFSLLTYTYARRLKTLQGLTPFEYIYKIWTSDPDRVNVDPTLHMPRLNT
jgi:transposase InsO family protein